MWHVKKLLRNNNLVSGSVTVSLKEILSVKDVLFSGVFTESDGKLLASGGEFFFEITETQLIEELKNL